MMINPQMQVKIAVYDIIYYLSRENKACYSMRIICSKTGVYRGVHYFSYFCLKT